MFQARHEEVVNAEKVQKFQDGEEDIVSMDYLAPRRKTPIHN